ncbi:hypothetical protein TYRP_010844, partial [Tyrophagus putrescentiae]
KNNITEDEIVKIGLAEIITHYNRHKFDIHLSTPLHLTGNRVETKYKNTLFESQITRNDESALIFTDMFTRIRAADTMWYIYRNSSIQRMNELKDKFFLEQMSSINMVLWRQPQLTFTHVQPTLTQLLRYLSFDLKNCLNWAQSIWKTCFVDNVKTAAIKLQSSGEKRHQASKVTSKHNFDFIQAAALMLANSIGLKYNDNDIKILDLQIASFLNDSTSYEVKLFPTYRKIKRFTDLAHINMPPLQNNIRMHSEINGTNIR